ncbi:MAG: hypothetical protein JW940_18735 [Polyangiaceae bacterium]|nr:hypothetical protein [Polyangiaceae bacterium]
MVAARRLYVTAGALLAAGLGCLVVALLRNDNVEDVFGGIEGAYFNRSVFERGHVGVFDSSVFTGKVLSPFHIGNAYLWLGAGVALALAALAVALVTRFGLKQS